MDAALHELPRGETLLDVGCGSGVLGSVLLARKTYAEVHGLELSEEAVERARARGLITVAFNLHSGEFPYADGTFDAVTCLAVLEHVFDPRPLVGEMARVLKPGGVCIVDTPNIRYAKHVWALVVRGRFPVTSGNEEDRRLAYDGGHLHYFTRRDIVTLLGERGLQPVRSVCVLPPKLRRGALGALAGILSRVPALDEWLSAEVFVVARKTT